MPFCWGAEAKAESQRIVGATSKIEPDLLGQEKQEKGREGDNEMGKKIKIVFKNICQKVTRSCHNGKFLEVE